MCSTLLEAPIPYKFCASLPTAQQRAAQEAADTCGIVLHIKSIRIEPNCVVVTGLVASAGLVFGKAGQFPTYLQPRSIGNLHLTWDSLLHPNTTDDIGYLVLQTPVAAADSLPESEDGDTCWVALTIQRTFHSLKPGSIGAVCCARCNRPIPSQRLLAVPQTRICTNCQQKKENNT